MLLWMPLPIMATEAALSKVPTLRHPALGAPSRQQRCSWWPIAHSLLSIAPCQAYSPACRPFWERPDAAEGHLPGSPARGPRACGFEESLGPNSISLSAMLMEAPAAEQPCPNPFPPHPHCAARLAVGGVGSCSDWYSPSGRSAEAGDIPNPFERPFLPHAGLLLADALSWQKDSRTCVLSEAGRAASDRLAADGGSHCPRSMTQAAAQAALELAVGSDEQLREGPPAQAEANGAAAAVAACTQPAVDSVERCGEAPPVQAGDAMAAAAVAGGAQAAAGTNDRCKEAPPAQAGPAARAGAAGPQVPDSTIVDKAIEERSGQLAKQIAELKHSAGESKPDVVEHTAGPGTFLRRILPWVVRPGPDLAGPCIGWLCIPARACQHRPRLCRALHQGRLLQAWCNWLEVSTWPLL